MSERPIGIFDSGVGGLTVVKEVRKALPGEKLIYFGDTARVPYGIKGKETICRYALEDVRFLMRFDPKMIVVACNTASAAAIDVLREEVDVPVVDVLMPGAATAVATTKTGVVGVIATETTVESRAYERAITQLREGTSVISKACPLFVPMVEEGRLEGRVLELLAEEYIGSIVPLGIDTLVLGCTHYPPLTSVIQAVTGPGVTIVDSARETARVVKTVLEEHDLLSTGGDGATHYYASDNPERFRRLAAVFLGATARGVTLVEPEDFFRDRA